MESMERKTKRDPRLARAGVAGFNKPKRTPSHPTKSHVVVAKEGSQVKTIRFGQQGVQLVLVLGLLRQDAAHPPQQLLRLGLLVNW